MSGGEDRRGRLLVAAQTLGELGLFWPGASRWRVPPVVRAGSGAAMVGGVGLALWGLAQQGRQITPWPTPPRDAELFINGPYRFSRHPIYAGLLVGGAGLAAWRGRIEPLVAFGVLSAALHVKAGAEEAALRTRFGAAYEDYAAVAPRLIGWPSSR